MRTWSVEETIIRAQSAVAVAIQGVWDKLVAVERVTRPPRLGHDVDAEVDGAEWLADMEAAIDAWEPDELPNLYEPALSADELVGVRGLLQERYMYTPPTDNLAAGARAAGSSPSEVSGPSSPPWPPSEGCTNPPRSDPLATVRGEGGAPDSGIQPSPDAPQPDPRNNERGHRA